MNYLITLINRGLSFVAGKSRFYKSGAETISEYWLGVRLEGRITDVAVKGVTVTFVLNGHSYVGFAPYDLMGADNLPDTSTGATVGFYIESVKDEHGDGPLLRVVDNGVARRDYDNLVCC